jgi:hypothetical protein
MNASESYYQKRLEFLHYLTEHKNEIEANVACHLGLNRTEKCLLSPTEDWIHGSFNLCVYPLRSRTGTTGRVNG